MWGREIRHFVPETFLVATPMGLTWKVLIGGTEKGLVRLEHIREWGR